MDSVTPQLDHTSALLVGGRDGWVAWTAVVVAVALLLIALVA